MFYFRFVFIKERKFLKIKMRTVQISISSSTMEGDSYSVFHCSIAYFEALFCSVSQVYSLTFIL